MTAGRTTSAGTRPLLCLDHLVLRARSLDEGVAHVRQALGVEMPPGGSHPRMGTHNRLLRLGDLAFLEVIAVDPGLPAPPRPRWYGMDVFDAAPSLSHWVLMTDDLDASLQALPLAGKPVEAVRGDLTWRISVPDDGSMGLDGAHPTLIEWPPGVHPSAGIESHGCALQTLTVTHPRGDDLTEMLSGMFDDPRVRIRSGAEFRITAGIRTPSGLRTL